LFAPRGPARAGPGKGDEINRAFRALYSRKRSCVRGSERGRLTEALRRKNWQTLGTTRAHSIGGIIGSTFTFRRCASGAIFDRRTKTGISAERCVLSWKQESKWEKARSGTGIGFVTPQNRGDFSYRQHWIYRCSHRVEFAYGRNRSLNLLVRARDNDEARLRLWHALQLHWISLSLKAA